MHPWRQVVASLALAAGTALADDAVRLDWRAPASAETSGRLSVYEGDAESVPSWPVWPERKGSVEAGFGARVTGMEWTGGGLGDRDLYAFRIPVQASLQVWESTRLLARVTPALHSDLKQVDEHDFRLNGLFLAFYPWRPNLQLAAGMLVGDSTGSYGVLPAAGVRWQPSEKWMLDLFMPRPRVLYRLDEVDAVFVSAGPAGGQWNIGRGGADDPERDLHDEAIQASLGWERRLRPALTLGVSAGWLFNRSLETDGAPDPELGDGVDLDDTVAFGISLKRALGRRPG